MLSKNLTEPQAPQPSGTAEAPALMDPQNPIEVATTGNGTVNDPGGTDNKPPGFDDQDPLFLMA